MDNAGVRPLGDGRRAGAPMRVVAAGDSAQMDRRSAEEEHEGWTPADGSKTRPGGTSSRPKHKLDSRQQSDLVRSIEGLRSGAPHLSAHTVLSTWQRNALAASVVVLVGCLLMDAVLTLQLLIGLASVGYCFTVVYRIVLVRGGMASRYLVRVSDADAWAVPDDELPIYTVLVPAYREPEVIGKVIRSVAALEYPTDRLDVRLLLEADDEETIAAADRELGHPSVRKVLVPPVQPRTKPKACNFGLLAAPGEFVTIYDAEDRPEPLQLRRAVVALRRLGARYACVQAQLGYFNAHQNRITRWFAVEYGNWFRFLLPGLVSVGAPVLLGGTSNHFRADLLRAAGSWDAFNVTEDADLGIRLARLGYRIGVLDSVTEEEANSDFINWVKQRSRWYKGYLQTWLVHTRSPAAINRELGWRGVLALHLFVAGTPLTALINPIFWALSIVWFAQQPEWLAALFPPAVFYVALACFVLGNAAMVYTSVLTVRVMNQPTLLAAAFTMPLYWVMMSAAAAKAMFQLVWHPFYWEKTVHGLFSDVAADVAQSKAAQ